MKRSTYYRKLTASGNGGFLLSLPPDWMKHPIQCTATTAFMTYLKSGELEITADKGQKPYAIIRRWDRPNCARVYLPKEWVMRNGYQKGDQVKIECLSTASKVILRLAPNG